MHQVKIDMICLQFFQFAFKQGFHLFPVVDKLCRHLRGNVHPVAVAVPQCLSQDDLGSFVQIDISGVQIAHSAVNGLPDQSDRLFFIDHAVSGSRPVKAHATQTES